MAEGSKNRESQSEWILLKVNFLYQGFGPQEGFPFSYSQAGGIKRNSE
jgi:hypothetical protein